MKQDDTPDEPWIPSSPPPLGKIVLLHQAYTGTGVCLYCGKPMDDWEPMQPCPGRKS